MEFVFCGVNEIRDIAAGVRFPGDTFTKIIDDHIMKTRALECAAASIGLINIDAVKDFDHLQDANLQSGFFQ